MSADIIPAALYGCRFIRLLPRSKWPPGNQTGHFVSDANNHAYNDPALLKHIQDGGNYGVILRNGVCVIDADSETLWDAIPAAWDESVVVQSGRVSGAGRHIYLLCPDAPPVKVTFPGDLGDARFSGARAYTVGPGSIHSSGNAYRVIGGPALVEVPWPEMHAWVEAQKGTVDIPKPRNDAGTKRALETGKRISDECGLRVEDFLMPNNPARIGRQIIGSHPIHGSTGGRNLCIDIVKNLWYCFRHNTGGDALLAYAVARGIIDCADARPGCLNDTRIMNQILTRLENEGLKPIYGAGIARALLENEDEPVSGIVRALLETTAVEDVEAVEDCETGGRKNG